MIESISTKEWQTLPEHAQQEVKDFFLFIKAKYAHQSHSEQKDLDTQEMQAIVNQARDSGISDMTLQQMKQQLIANHWSQMSSYQLTNQAQKDIEKLIEKGRIQFGIKQAISYFDELEKVFNLLAENPKMARTRHGLKPAVRAHPFQSHIILFEELENASILILTLRHSKENWLEWGRKSKPKTPDTV